MRRLSFQPILTLLLVSGPCFGQIALNLSKAFSPTPIVAFSPGNSTLTFTILNPNAVTATNIAFSDNLPPGLVTAGSLNPNCGVGSSITTTATTITIGVPSLAAGASCTMSLSVHTDVAATYNNVSSTITATDLPAGSAATATLVATTPPPLNLSKAFNPNPIGAPGNSTLTFTISNPNAAAVTNIAFSDTLPPGLVTAGSLSPNCGVGSSITTTATTITIGVPSLAAGASCTMSLSVHTDVAATYNNVSSTITATDLPAGSAATATLVATLPAPSFTKVFVPNTIIPGGASTLTFTITNNGGIAVTGLTFTDTLPAGVVVATPNGLANSCGGTATATAGSGSISLTGGVVSAPLGTACTISVNVVGVTEGIQNNTTSTLTSANALPAAAATATLIVASPPVLTKSFGQVSILPGSTTSLMFTLTNPNTVVTLTGLAFTDTLPAGLVVATPNGLAGSCDGGTITAAAGSASIDLSGATLAPGASCTFLVNVASTGTVQGYVTNTTSTVTSNEAVPGAPASATLFIGDPFQISYTANLTYADSAINITNTGANASAVNPVAQTLNGNLCVNVYTFSPDEQLVDCCACYVTPNALASLSARSDLINNTLTPGKPSSVVVKLLATLAGPAGASGPGTTAAPTCSAISVAPLGPAGAANTLALGLAAWSDTVHALGPSAVLPSGGTVPPAGTTLGVTEIPFSHGTLSAAEIERLTKLCGFIQGNGSGFGICNSCRSGGLGAANQ